MSISVVATKYADALFQLAKEKNEVERIQSELQIVKEILRTNNEIITFLKSPRVKKEEKHASLRKAFNNFSPYVLNTLLLLTDRHRADSIIPTIDAFIAMSYDLKGIATAKIESVRTLTEEERAAISSVFAKKMNKTALEIENVVNSDLLGGLKIQIGNRIFDGSLRGKLNGLKRELLG
ncbi:F0F1 ATP synthase subunit delta [Bacillus andreraoultii]|uniref:F0F1 ATP synthase subunit delta n=1 Tax=Bacillus andreraoultii TaxID=1499685 RepID=UPI00053B3A03|nr:F0F1 ATP synthase subunit delta [Bacillus andreraoultii]